MADIDNYANNNVVDNMDKLIHNNDFTYYDSTFGIVRWQEKYLITHLIERKPSEAVDDVAELRNRKRSSRQR